MTKNLLKQMKEILNSIETYSHKAESIFERLEKGKVTNKVHAVKDLKDIVTSGIKNESVKLNDFWNSLTRQKPEIKEYKTINECIENISKAISDLEKGTNERNGAYLSNTDVYCREIRSNTGAIRTQLKGRISSLLY